LEYLDHRALSFHKRNKALDISI